jgi:beta-glucosidase
MKRGKPVIIVTAAGSAINVDADCDAEIHAWYPGQCGGKALADIIFGKTSPSGKLPVTFYKNAEGLPDFEDYSMKNRTYRYVESNENILYPFGYGLTYSKVECTDIEYNDGTATVTVTNSGEYDTEDVVQLYIKGYSENAVLNYSLCGFKRVSLAKGETQTIELKIAKSAFEAINGEGERVSGGDKFTLYAGTAQPDEISTNLTGTKSVSVDIKF